MYADEGEVEVLALRALATSETLPGCGSRALGWSADGQQLLLYRQVLGPCAITVPVCATGDVVAFNLHTKSAMTMIKASYMRRKKLGDPEVVKWDKQGSILYAWSMTSPIGGLGALIAVRVPSEQIRWAVESYGATLLTDGRLANLDRNVTDLEKTGFNWEWRYQLIRGGKVATQYATLPTSGECGISADGRYVWWQPTDSESEVHFATKSNANLWWRSLPPGFEVVDQNWTPSDALVVQAYERRPQGALELNAWLLDPDRKEAVRLFEGTSPLKPTSDPITAAYNALRLARWAR